MNKYDASSILKPHPNLTYYFKYPWLFVLAVIRFSDHLYFVNSDRMCPLKSSLQIFCSLNK